MNTQAIQDAQRVLRAHYTEQHLAGETWATIARTVLDHAAAQCAVSTATPSGAPGTAVPSLAVPWSSVTTSKQRSTLVHVYCKNTYEADEVRTMLPNLPVLCEVTLEDCVYKRMGREIRRKDDAAAALTTHPVWALSERVLAAFGALVVNHTRTAGALEPIYECVAQIGESAMMWQACIGLNKAGTSTITLAHLTQFIRGCECTVVLNFDPVCEQPVSTMSDHAHMLTRCVEACHSALDIGTEVHSAHTRDWMCHILNNLLQPTCKSIEFGRMMDVDFEMLMHEDKQAPALALAVARAEAAGTKVWFGYGDINKHGVVDFISHMSSVGTLMPWMRRCVLYLGADAVYKQAITVIAQLCGVQVEVVLI